MRWAPKCGLFAWGAAAFALAGAGCDDGSLTLLRVLGPAIANWPRQVEIHSGLEYARRDDRALNFDLFQPFPRNGPTPLIINVHGGGWREGTRDQLVEFSYDFAANGYATAQIDYRVAQDGVVFPAPVADVLEAVRYFQAHAEEFQIDANRIALFGASAGGHLALLASLSNDTSVFDSSRPVGETSGVKAAISIFGPTDLTVEFDSGSPDIRILVENFLGRPLDEATDLRIAASPITYVRSDAPPVLIIHGDIDSIVPVDQARRLIEAMQSLGQPFRYIEVPGMDHYFGAIWQTGFGQQHRNAAFDFLAANL